MWANYTFQYPWFLLLIPLALVTFWRYRKSLTKPQAIYGNFSSNGADDITETWRIKLIKHLLHFKLLGMCLLFIALARPQKLLDNTKIDQNGIDIVLALDLSQSMLINDFDPNRLEVSKKMAAEFVDKRVADRIGLVVFSGESFTVCPLTIDHRILKEYISMQQSGVLTDGTAIGMGLAVAVNRLIDSNAKSKVVILLTDGVNNAGYIDPQTAKEMAVNNHIKVYTIGVGYDFFNQHRGMFDMANMQAAGQLDERLLAEIAKATGGKYFRAADEKSLSNIYAEIDRLEKTKIEGKVVRKHRDLYRTPEILGFLVLFLAFITQFWFNKLLNGA